VQRAGRLDEPADGGDGPLSLKARADRATAGLRRLIESGELALAPAWLRDDISAAAMALATIVSAENRVEAIVAGERALDRARVWLIDRA